MPVDLYRNRIEDWSGGPDPKIAGPGARCHVQPPADPHPFFNALLEAAESVGLQRFEHSSGRLMEAEGGCALIDEIVHDGEAVGFRSDLLQNGAIEPDRVNRRDGHPYPL